MFNENIQVYITTIKPNRLLYNILIVLVMQLKYHLHLHAYVHTKSSSLIINIFIVMRKKFVWMILLTKKYQVSVL